MTSQERKSLALAITHKKLSPDVVANLQHRCRTDLFFLAKDILGKDLTELTHREVTDFFVKKDNTKSIKEQDDIKDRLLLYPRGSYKSTINYVDTAQWIINFPNVRVQILTGSDALATGFVEEVQNYFLLVKNHPPTLFQALFPEFCINKESNAGEFYCPVRSEYFKEPTVFSSSIDASNSGWHCDVQKIDDAVQDRNSATPYQLELISKKIYMVRKLLMPYGFQDVAGTHYSLHDHYSIMKEKAGIKELYGNINTDELKYLCRPAWWVKEESKNKPEAELGEADYALLFPEGLSYKFLKKELKKDKFSFNSQYLNNPLTATPLMFSRERLVAATVPYTQFPTTGKTFVSFDLAYSTKKYRDYTCGAVGLVDASGGLWIKEIILGRYASHEISYIIAQTIRDWKPLRTCIEDIPGAQWLTGDINNQAQRMHIPLSIDWMPIIQNGKEPRVRMLDILLSQGRLKFSAGITCLEEVFKQFIMFGGNYQDDAPDAIALLAIKFMANVPYEMDQRQLEAWKKLQEEDLYQKIYGLGEEEELIPREPQQTFDVETGLPNSYVI